MSKFSEMYKDMLMPSLPLYGLGEIVSYGGFRWEITAFKANKTENCWVYNLKRVDGSDETETGIYELGLIKSYQMEKSEGMTAGERIKYYMQKLGISAAGPVPNSLLSMQDLEPRTKTEDLYLWRQDKQTGGQEVEEKMAKSGTDLFSFAVWYYDKFGAQKCAVFNNVIDAEAFANLVEAMGFNDVKIMKGQIEQTGKQLQRLAAKAEDAETNEEKSLIQRIKNVQIKRQKATLAARAKETPESFKSFWQKTAQNQ